jgi:hypothetical protein
MKILLTIGLGFLESHEDRQRKTVMAAVLHILGYLFAYSSSNWTIIDEQGHLLVHLHMVDVVRRPVFSRYSVHPVGNSTISQILSLSIGTSPQKAAAIVSIQRMPIDSSLSIQMEDIVMISTGNKSICSYLRVLISMSL